MLSSKKIIGEITREDIEELKEVLGRIGDNLFWVGICLIAIVVTLLFVKMF